MNAVTVLVVLACFAAPARARSPEGLWETRDDHGGDRRSLVHIRFHDGRLFGLVTRTFPRPGEGPDPVCIRCEGSRRGQRVVGMEVLWGHREEGGRWTGGTILDPETGKEYRSTIWLEGPDQLRVRGHWGPFHRTQTWHRAQPAGDSR